jgi:hypothetical protein
MPDDDLEAPLVGIMLACHVPAEERIMRWWANPDLSSLRLRAHDHAPLLSGGLIGCHVDQATGRVEVSELHRPPLDASGHSAWRGSVSADGGGSTDGDPYEPVIDRE